MVHRRSRPRTTRALAVHMVRAREVATRGDMIQPISRAQERRASGWHQLQGELLLSTVLTNITRVQHYVSSTLHS